jgi:hypothetical protein
MARRANEINREMDQFEEATFEGGIPVRIDATTRVISKGVDGRPERSLAGVVLPASDKPGHFLTPGK